MGISSSHELARTFESEISVPEKAVRRWALVLDDQTLQGQPLDETEVLTQLSLGTYGASHPTWLHLGLKKVSIVERMDDSPYHAEAIAEYSYLTDQEVIAPTSRRADWKFETKPTQIPALFYYHDASPGVFSSNNDKRPLTNSSYDYLQGLVTDESLVQITITKNFWPFPTSIFGMQGFLNSVAYMTCPTYTLKCIGVTADYTQEFFANATHQYWATQIELSFRPSTWVLQVPDVGWNFISGNEKRRAMVFDEKNAEWVASPNPVGLNGSGQQTNGQPSILQRRVNPAMDFTQILKIPPTDGTWPQGSL